MSARTRRGSATSRGPKHVPLSSPATVLTGPTTAPATTLAGNVVSAKSALPDIRDCTMARLEEMKKQVDDDYASFVRELAASTARLSKRVKLDLQSSKKIADDVDTEHREFTADSTEDFKEIQVASEAITAASQSHLKATVPELLKSLENSIETLRSKYAKG